MSVRIELFAGETSLGAVDANVIDASMGVIGGILKPTAAYYANYQCFFQAHLENSEQEGLKALGLKAASSLTGQLTAYGGIDITDLTGEEGINEIEALVCGIDNKQMATLLLVV
jgi:hypothetical protein